MTAATAPFRAVICGGGIAGIEGLLRLRRLTGTALNLTLVSPGAQLTYRPLTVLEPFDHVPVRQCPISRIVADTGANWVPDALQWIDRHEQIVRTTSGLNIDYDAVLLAVGGREQSELPMADTFTGRDGGTLYRAIVDDIRADTVTRLAFVIPAGPVWPLPLYELAMMTARLAHTEGHRLTITFVIGDSQPLAVLGETASDRITQMFSELGISLVADAHPVMPAPGQLSLRPGQRPVEFDRIVTLPTPRGPNIPGIPGYATDRYLHVDAYCRVLDAGGRIFAAGDATHLAVKHGGIGTQQADTAANAIAHLAGYGPPAAPLRPRLDATLLTGATPLYLSAHLIGGRGWQTTFYDKPPWPTDDKLVAEELGPYLRSVTDD